MNHEIVFRLPVVGLPQALVRTTYGLDGAVVSVDGKIVARALHRKQLECGIEGCLADGERLELLLRDNALSLSIDGELAVEEKRLSAPTSRSAWVHAWIALSASAAGFVAGYLYLRKAELLDNAWAMKMAYHTAMWHLLLTFTLFPASAWGQRIGIRTVQFVSVVFLLIHIGIAIANFGWSDSSHDGWIAALNALSGIGFAASLVYGQIAYRDMDPIAANRKRMPQMKNAAS